MSSAKTDWRKKTAGEKREAVLAVALAAAFYAPIAIWMVYLVYACRGLFTW